VASKHSIDSEEDFIGAPMIDQNVSETEQEAGAAGSGSFVQ